MAKGLPVGAVVNEAVQFGLHRWGAVIRFFWAPFVAYALVLGLGVASVIDYEAMQKLNESGVSLSNLGEILRLPIPVSAFILSVAILFGLLLMSGAYASIYDLVATGTERRGIFQLRLDGPAVRVFCALCIMGFLSFAIYGVCVLIASAWTGQSISASFDALKQIFVIMSRIKEGGEFPLAAVMEYADALAPLTRGGLLSIIPSIYISVKLTPFAPGSAVENRLTLFQSVSMTTGAAWSIFASWFLFFVFLFIATIIFQLAVSIVEGVSTVLTNQGGAMAFVAAALALVIFVVSLIFQAFTTGAQLALQAIVYRRLKTGE